MLTTLRHVARHSRHIADVCATRGADCARWQIKWDPVMGSVFFFNVRSKEKMGEQKLTRKEAEFVALDHYIARQAR